jgi:hypothetical protein
MNNITIPLDYANSLIYELEKAFWDERGKGARFRMTKVGYDILEKIQEVLEGEGIIAKVSYSREDRLLKVSVKGCIHRQVEENMLAKGIEPFTCVPANLIVLAIEEKLDIPVELAEIKMEEGACQLLLILFDKRPSLD